MATTTTLLGPTTFFPQAACCMCMLRNDVQYGVSTLVRVRVAGEDAQSLWVSSGAYGSVVCRVCESSPARRALRYILYHIRIIFGVRRQGRT